MIKFLKIRDVKSPERDFLNSGIDMFVPNYSEEFLKVLKEKNPTLNISEGGIVLHHGESVNIPSGCKAKFAPNISLEAANKSGVATKKKLLVGACIVDASYQGEMHLHVINAGLEDQVIRFGDKLVQFIPRFIDIDKHEVYEGISSEEFYNYETTTRGEGGFGSTGTK